MAAEVWTGIISGVVGLLTGGSVTAWAQWGVEKRRLARQRQYALLDSWRAGIASLKTDDHTEALGTAWYETLRPYIPDYKVDQLQRQRTVIVPPDNGRGAKDLFTREVDRIERQWGLRP